MRYLLLLSIIGLFLTPNVNSQESDELAVLFPKDISLLSQSAKHYLDSVIEQLKTESIKEITLSGHTDEEGSKEYNLDLSRKRAINVKSYLIKNKIDSTKIKIDYHGKEKPISTEDSYNRRVQIIIYYENEVKNETCVATFGFLPGREIPIDVDQDEKADFYASYNLVGNGVNSSASGSFGSKNDNEFIYCSDKSHMQLNVGDTIFLNSKEGCMWNSLHSTIVSLNKEKKKWLTPYTNNSTLYVAIKLKYTDTTKLGWIKFDFDPCTGRFEKEIKVFDQTDYIVIE